MRTILTTLLVLAGVAHAQDDALWFVGKMAPANAFGDPARSAVFLRWGVTEGALPADVVGFELELDGAVVFETAAQPRPTAAAVEAAYRLHPRKRALLAASLESAGEGALGLAVERRLAGRTPADQQWRRLAFQLDPVLAQLGGRGYVGRDAGEYALYAVNAAGRRALLGQVRVAARVQPAVAPEELIQVTDLGRCDAPETGRRHGVVALSWDTPGAPGSADRLAHGLDLAGYEVYRATTAGDPQALDFGALARRAVIGPDGYPQLPGLERINAAPIAPAQRPEPGADGRATDDRFQGWNPTFAQWMETATAVAAAGLKPGDRRAYYVVPRDFTGNFGQAASLLVTVPDELAPPAPWAVRSVPVPGGLSVEWWHVDPRNYHDAHPSGRTWCNLDTAQDDGRLVFAGSGTSCAKPDGVINADVSGYVLYRFDNSVLASRFTDTDGDGVSDAAEREGNNPGLACDPNRQPPGATDARVAQIRAEDVRDRDGRKVLQFFDALGGSLRAGRVHWYRVAAIGRNGQVSALSAPVQGLFPDVSRPDRLPPDHAVYGWCAPRAEQDENFLGTYAVDFTQLADEVRYYCHEPIDPEGGGEVAQEIPGIIRTLIHTEPVADLPDGRRGTFGPGVCQALPNGCILVADFVTENGRVLGRTAINPYDRPPQGGPGPCRFTATLRHDCAEEPEPIEDGQTVYGPPVIGHPGVGPCFDVLRVVDGRRYRVRTLCPGDLWLGEETALGPDLMCFEIQPVGSNGQTGTSTPLPCFRRGDVGEPDPPRIDLVRFEGQDAGVGWTSAPQSTAGIFLEWRAEDGPASARFVSHAGRYDGGERHEATIELPPLGEEIERWCFRGRSVGRDVDPAHGVSEWSAWRCFERVPPGVVLPDYLPWPNQPAPPELGTLQVRYLMPDRIPVIALSRTTSSVIEAGECNFGPAVQCEGENPCALDQVQVAARPNENASCDFCARVEARLGPNRRFVVYRQRRHADGAIDPFHQVSPRLDGMFCSKSCNDPFGCDPNNDPYGFCAVVPNAEAGCGNNLNPSWMFDPYIKPLVFPPGDPWPLMTLAFVDRSPHAAGSEYRYQLVYFDDRGEIIGRRGTDWVQAPNEGAL